MIKSITDSREYSICKESKIRRDFSSVLNDLDKLDCEINEQVKKYKDKQILSQNNATQIWSR